MTHRPSLLRLAVLGGLSGLLLVACGEEPAQESPLAEPAAAPAAAPSGEDLVQAAVDTMTEENYRRHVETLSSDAFGGRAPGTKGEELTVAYLIDHFEEIGLEPANNGVYTQDVPLVSVEIVNKPELVISGPDGDVSLAYGPDQVIGTRRQVDQVALEDSELVFVGYGISAPERDWDDYAGIDVTGKTVVILVNDPGYATQDPALFNGNAMTYYGRWTYKYDEAARQGAAGAIIVHDTLPAAYGWPTVENSWTGPQFNMELEDQGARLSTLEGWITKEQARALMARAGQDLDALYEAAKQPGFRAVPLDGLTASASMDIEMNRVVSQNVAGVIRGSEAPEEVFIYMAHWDHLGTDESLEGDQIYNGALDNASGTAALMEIARAYQSLGQAPRRSVLFLALAAEEQGLLGSRFYASEPLFPLENTVGGLNMDGMNNFGETRDITVVGLGMSDLDDYLAAAAAEQERFLEADREAEKGYYFRSDHFELAKEGVPMLYPNKGYDHREKGVAYGMEKANEYTEDHYHRVSDEYDLSWVVTGALEDMETFFRTGLDVANSDAWPNWKEGTEFRGKRDAQRAGLD
ncbi:MAG: M28 family metallopeptidase [Xanthomonadales bacterium]|jgi:Zn-dependent M28 family amino/carboxypeptidase|nr:M28 family metallopeptidase [Xanthomonadales bacterium]